MKTRFLSVALATMCCLSANAQLVVEPNGNVGIKCTGTATSPLSVGEGHDGFTASVNSSGCGLEAIGHGAMYNNVWSYGLKGLCYNTSGNTFKVGMMGYAVPTVSPYSGRCFGVAGHAGDGTSGWNYGVYGQLEGTVNGAGVYGTSTRGEGGSQIDGRYAGYFHGKVKITSDLIVNGSMNGMALSPAATSPSNDAELSYLERLSELRATTFYHSYPQTASSQALSDTISTTAAMSPIMEQSLSRVHYGLQTEQLKEIFPELVYEQEDGTLGVNYIELIPVLVQTVNELNSRLQDLEGTSPKQAQTTAIRSDVAEEAALWQNAPNPTSENTTISYYVPASASTAEILICDMNGQLKKSVAVTDKGKSSVTISTIGLASGLYLYSLVVDGKLYATKRMIVKH